ncbi:MULTISPECIES: efflux RND transporter periplasmic adaptor subunit [Pedobacter]|uniref:Efflux transporter, RND family, MFP subunit n=1 Tax=Pedobacter heparinus (strain ATCC 13125 / DSM 2366 / CIP 104194 / JCM 7457 / NBRC 12017 / NCIMB 9290 / NRRL B-14731 / HIM 762-3) TaxID=485917 RepID=C6XS61_PEDHD|nr:MULTISPECIES: efflux RND transporter periplasmic adaptor subunit [Pedobacter]ACU03406.1 efflux transporter, RND family, MFP subunit [Pedobacter heparinus DSM 2366]MBB5439117.1 membrane fusion protein (multidrug efflux system) [Pedobacter sp. AK017]
MKTTIQSFYLLIPVLLIISSCGNSDQKKPGAAADQVQSYPVFTITTQSTDLETDYPATLEGIQNVDIRPKVDGFIEKIYVDEGATVKKGQLLFSINAPQYEQLVRTATAAISSAEADVNSAQLQVNKTKPLVDKDIISKYDLDAAQLTLQSRKAALAQARAELVNAKVNLGYTRITSPVDGVIGSIPFKTGSLVSSSSASPLTTVSNISRVYAYFSMNEKQLLEFSRHYKGTNLATKLKNIPAVSLVLADGTIYAENGKIESINGLINTSTGSASLRATFSNPATLLRSGASASVRIPQHLENIILIPQKVTTDLQGKKFVYVLDEKGNVKNTEVEVMELTKGNFYVVTKGLKTGDKVVLEGFQSLKDGTQIKPEEKSADSVFADLQNK